MSNVQTQPNTAVSSTNTNVSTASVSTVLEKLGNFLVGDVFSSHWFMKGLGVAATLVGILDTNLANDIRTALVAGGVSGTTIVHWVEAAFGK